MSLLDELREDADQARAQNRKVLAIPGSRFAVRYQPPPRDKLTAFISAYRANSIDSDDELQFLVDCCDEILRRDGDGGGEPADPDGGAWTFDGSDERWGDDVNTARECVAKLYRLDQQPLAAANHVEALVVWLAGVEAEAARRVEGKPPEAA